MRLFRLSRLARYIDSLSDSKYIMFSLVLRHPTSMLFLSIEHTDKMDLRRQEKSQDHNIGTKFKLGSKGNLTKCVLNRMDPMHFLHRNKDQYKGRRWEVGATKQCGPRERQASPSTTVDRRSRYSTDTGRNASNYLNAIS